jgi:protein-S-isoprenylcysteine O-methyltransferase Ste14
VLTVDEELLFRLLFVAIYAVFFGVRIRYRVESARREPERRQKSESWATKLLIVAILGYFASIILYLLDVQWVSWLRLALPTWLRWLGAAGAASSVVLVAWTHRTLGRQYSAEFAIQKDHVLVTTGPYARTRHPMYTGFNALSLSMAMISSNLLLLLFAVLVALPFPWIAEEEERMLLETFGEEYREYMGRTGMFFPRMRQRSE